MNIKIGNYTSEKNSFPKSKTWALDLSGQLKNTSSIVNPTILVEAVNPSAYNYMYIPEFERYYFIDDIVSVNNNKWEVSGHVDVLETYKNSILSQSAVIKRQQNKFNLYLNDPDFQTYNYDMIQTKKFSASGFNKALNYVLVVNGS